MIYRGQRHGIKKRSKRGAAYAGGNRYAESASHHEWM
jgi:hypothetical protein